jgi:L-ascorbate metabolism protein UlaG (beta-lactamase superfamily)
VAQALLGAGAAPDAVDAQGATPLCLARRYGHGALAADLEARGATVATASDQPRCALGLDAALPAGEAVVRYLGHSAWAVQTASHFLVFDYAPVRRLPDEPCLRNGRLDAAELAGRPVVFFASHAHADHYAPVIFELAEKLPGSTVILGFEAEDVPPHETMGPREVRRFGEVEVTTIASNDSGVGFVVTVDGVTILHAGDHANRTRDFSGNYMDEIEWLVERDVHPQIALLPISGCNFGDQEAVRLGVWKTLETLQPAAFLPMHSGGDCKRYGDFIGRCAPDFPGIAMEMPLADGDAFHWRAGALF